MQDSSLYEELEKVAKEHKQKIFKISGATGEGVEELMNYVSKTLKILPKENLVEIKEKEKVYTLNDEPDFIITREKGAFVVKGEKVDSIMRKVNIGDYESLFYLHKRLDEIGLNQALKKQGIKDGDIVKIGDYEMEWED